MSVFATLMARAPAPPCTGTLRVVAGTELVTAAGLVPVESAHGQEALPEGDCPGEAVSVEPAPSTQEVIELVTALGLRVRLLDGHRLLGCGGGYLAAERLARGASLAGLGEFAVDLVATATRLRLASPARTYRIHHPGLALPVGDAVHHIGLVGRPA